MDVVYDPCAGLIVESSTSNEAMLASIDEAFTLWADVLSGVRLSRAQTPGFERVRLDLTDAPEALRGVYDDERGIVYINERLKNARARAITVAHELGHAFGLWHVEGRDSVMNPGNIKFPPTSEDAASVRELWPTCRPPAND